MQGSRTGQESFGTQHRPNCRAHRLGCLIVGVRLDLRGYVTHANQRSKVALKFIPLQAHQHFLLKTQGNLLGLQFFFGLQRKPSEGLQLGLIEGQALFKVFIEAFQRNFRGLPGFGVYDIDGENTCNISCACVSSAALVSIAVADTCFTHRLSINIEPPPLFQDKSADLVHALSAPALIGAAKTRNKLYHPGVC